MATRTIKLEVSEHKGQKVILLKFDKDKELINLVKSIPLATWSNSRAVWYIPQNSFNLTILFQTFKGIAFIDFSALKKNSTKDTPLQNVVLAPTRPNDTPNINLRTFQIWLHHKRYSENTIKTYSDLVKNFLTHTSSKPITGITNDDVVNYVYKEIVGKGYSFAHQNQVVSALKLFFREVVKSEIDVDKIRRPRMEHKLPNVLSKEEVKRILTAPKNIKHKTMLSLIYACGLRRSELLNLKPSSIDSKRGLLIIRQAKGYKDRIVPVSEKTITMLREYYLLYKPKNWLFEGQQPGEQYSAESLQKVLKDAINKAKISKPVTLHWLRHSYATHLLENGTDLRYIQELLGHKSSRTTEIYTHVSTQSIQKIKSPFDDL